MIAKITKLEFQKLCKTHTRKQIAELTGASMSSVHKWIQKFDCRPLRSCWCGYVGPDEMFARQNTCNDCVEQERRSRPATNFPKNKAGEQVQNPIWPTRCVSQMAVPFRVQGAIVFESETSART